MKPKLDHSEDAPWMCAKCGYLMDANVVSEGPHVEPEEGDLSICLNCADVYWREGTKWRPIKPAEWASLPLEQRREIIGLTLVHRRVITEDLNKGRGGRA